MWSYIKNSLHSIFVFHPQDVCMTYVEHFMFSLCLSGRFTIGAIQAFIHAIIPVLFKTSSSDLVSSIETTLNTAGCRRAISYNDIINILHEYPECHYD